jgi:UDP-N-acetylglucosamine transferase subunit ALG13
VIFTTIGSSVKGRDFTRLIVAMDFIAGRLGIDVLIQRGPVDYEPIHARHVRFVRFNEALRLFKQADLVVGHCGTGTILNAIRFRKPLIVVPRRKAAGEMDMDDHQVQLAHTLEKIPGIRVVWNIERLEDAVRKALLIPQVRPQPSKYRRQFVEAIQRFLNNGK